MIQIPSQTKALIFDCDGTIADTMPLHFVAWNKAFAQYGTSLSEEMFYGTAGIPTIPIIELLNENHGYNLPAHEVAALKERYFEEMIDQVKPIFPVVDVIEAYHGKMPMAVATGGIRRLCEKTLKTLGLFEKFDAIFTADETKNGKPDPEIFFKCANQMQVLPEFCCVFEDGDKGIEGAEKAGMFVIDIRNFL